VAEVRRDRGGQLGPRQVAGAAGQAGGGVGGERDDVDQVAAGLARGEVDRQPGQQRRRDRAVGAAGGGGPRLVGGLARGVGRQVGQEPRAPARPFTLRGFTAIFTN
jgi:hypothetical protein